MNAPRERVAAQLEQVLRRDGLDNPWGDREDASTRWIFGDGSLYDASRLRLHGELIDTARRKNPGAFGGALAAVVTAGPPGAGKSTALALDPRLEGFRDIDADDFKDALLIDARERGLLDRWLHDTLEDGRPIMPRELAGFVHAESTALADAMREDCLVDGENIVIHGTLSSIEYVGELLAELDGFGYEQLIIYDVEVPAEIAVERALDRWWSTREAGVDPLGGRFVPPAGIRAYYPEDISRAVTAANAQMLHDRAARLGWDVELAVVDAR
ncbi:zeta toxin protein [Mycetocola tolaasinivorans]|uniref:UDP-N-acetylglucosamine kinase n=1 Tax=Mycetocola tolaasinivorans TaxID=76635 RepID=A0A3L7A890_9MICO|nr:zeta toxin family protein [Mycetocola tolaasinivorans]RLP76553.1 zeta toxin protein [Mycetocola tolaasinivorans]